MSYSYYLWIACFLFLSSLFSEKVLEQTDSTIFFEVDLSKKQVAIDENLQVTLKIKAPYPFKVNQKRLRQNLMEYGGLGPSPFELLSEEILSENSQNQSFIYTLDPEILGTQKLTFGMVEFVKSEEENAEPLLFPTGVFTVSVVEDHVATADYQGAIAPLMPLSLEYPVDLTSHNRISYVDNPQLEWQEREKQHHLFLSQWWPFLIVIFFFSIKGTIVLLVLLSIIYKKRNFFLKKFVMKGARERSLQRLDALKDVPSELNYIELSSIVRDFIEQTWGIKLSTMTTREFFLIAAQNKSLSSKNKSMIGSFLSDADLVKFAQEVPSEEMLKKSYCLVREFIETCALSSPSISEKNFLLEKFNFFSQIILEKFIRKVDKEKYH